MKNSRIEDDIKLDFSDVLIKPSKSQVNSRKDIKLECDYKFATSELKWSGIPIMASNMDGVGTIEMAETLGKQGLFTCLVKTYSAQKLIDFFDGYGEYRCNNTAMSIGISDSDYDKFKLVYNTVMPGRLKFVCIDVANGYSKSFTDFIDRLRKEFPKVTIIAGNVVTKDMTRELIKHGVDIVKVGIGPGSVCTTRIQTGIGYPQFSAVLECAEAAHDLGRKVISDGGCTCPGDVAKAFAAGADFVMLGGMLAGHDEGGGERIEELHELSLRRPNSLAPDYEVRTVVEFYGMSSDTAMKKYHGGVAEYRSSEGRTVKVPYRGPVMNTVQDLLGGIRSTCTYVGAPTLKHLYNCATFIKVNNQYNRVFTK